MKKQIIVICLASLFSTTRATELDLQLNWTDEAKVAKPVYRSHYSSPQMESEADSVEHIVTPAFQNAIHPEDAAAGSNPAYDIIKSGRYYLANDFRIAVTTSGASFLRVNAHNVTLDMNSKVITPHVSATQTNLVGILVNNKNNVHVLNGTVQCDDTNGTQRIATGINLGTSASYTTKINGLFVNRFSSVGITGQNKNDISLENTSANNGDGSTASTAVTGVSLTTCKNIKISNCEVNNNSTDTDDCIGILLSACEDGTIDHLTASSNVTTDTDNGDQGIGVSVAAASKNLVFTDCVASNNRSNAQQSAATSHSIGFSIAASPLNKFVRCVANGNGDDGTNGIDNDVAGFDISGASHSCSFINCEASKNVAEDNNGPSADVNAYGFKVDGGGAINNLYFEGCIANANEANSASNATDNAAGFWLAGLKNSKLVNCQAHKNDSEDQHAYGFYLAQSSSAGNMNNILEGCQAKGNVAGAANTNAIGFYSNTGLNNKFHKCVSNGNTCSTAASSLTVGAGASGFNLVGATRSEISECEAVGNIIASHATSRSYGFYLGATANGCVVRDSYSAYNTAGAAGETFGFYDGTAAGSFNTLFMGNVSVGQGKVLTSYELDASFKWQTDSNSEPVNVGGSTALSLNYFWLNAGTGDNPQNVIHEVPRLSLASLSTSVKMWENVSIYG